MSKVFARLAYVSPLLSMAIFNPSYGTVSPVELSRENLAKIDSSLTNQIIATELGQREIAISSGHEITPPSPVIEGFVSIREDERHSELETDDQQFHSPQQSPQLITQLVQAPDVTPELLEPNPNQERFPQPTQTPEPLPEQEQTPPPPQPTTPPPSGVQATYQVEEITVTGSTIFDQSTFSPLTQPLLGQRVTFAQLSEIANAITQMYLGKGYITTRAILVKPDPNLTTIEIRVIEGSLEAIEVQGTERLNPGYVRSRVKLGATIPLNTSKLEDQLRLLRINPLFENVEASLRAGSGSGQSILVVRVKEANPFGGNLAVDNYSPPSVGSERLVANLFHRNLTGHGDTLSGRVTKTTAGNTYTFDFNYRIPINAMNGTIDVRTRINRNEVIQEPFDVLDIRGESELYEISYRQPLILTPREELSLSAGFAFQEGQTFTFAGPTPFGFGPDEGGISRTSVFKFAQEYVRRDLSGAWAFRSLMNFGVDILDATDNSGNIPDGQFFSWLGQIQRVQVLNPDNLLIIQGDLQLTPDPLLASQQFVIGGGQSVRGFRQNVRAADNGLRFSVEDRITLVRDSAGAPYFQLMPFFELGYVWNHPDNPNFLQSQTFIAGIGTGLLWQPIPNLNVKLDFALPLVDLDDRGENAQDDGIYFNVDYRF